MNFGRFGAEGGLLEDFGYSGAAFELGFGAGVEVGGELGEGGEFAVLGEFEFDLTSDFFVGFGLGSGAYA